MSAKISVPARIEMHDLQPSIEVPVGNIGTSDLDVTQVEIVDSDAPFNVDLRGFTVKPGKTHHLRVSKVGLAAATANLVLHSNDGTHTVAIVCDAGSGERLDPCFAADTLVLLADGTTRAISELAAGDELTTIDELAHAHGTPFVTRATVEHVLRHDQHEQLLDLGGIRVTANHRWAARDQVEPRFVMTTALDRDRHQLLACAQRVPTWHAVPAICDGGAVEVVWNLTTTARTYCVAASIAGPFFVVHNMKPSHHPLVIK